jgi:DNA-binding transcriptional LysR family regulator
MPDAALFVATVEAGSFAAAAALHGLTPSGVSKAVSRLESDLGVLLLVRSTRRLRLTDEGELFHGKCRDALALMREAAELASETSRTLRGTLRVGMPPALATHVGLPLLQRFMARHEGLTVDLVRLMDASAYWEAHVDCALVAGDVTDATLAGREVGTGTLVTVASPDYRRRRGVPAEPADLAAHDCVGLLDAAGNPRPWTFRTSASDAAPLPTRVEARLRVEEFGVSLAAALEGMGIAQVPLFLASQDLEAGRLLRLMPAHEAAGQRAWIVFPASRVPPRRVRALVDFAVEDVGARALAGVRRSRPARPARA